MVCSIRFKHNSPKLPLWQIFKETGWCLKTFASKICIVLPEIEIYQVVLRCLCQYGMQVGLLIWLIIGPLIRNHTKVVKEQSVLSHIYLRYHCWWRFFSTSKFTLRNAADRTQCNAHSKVFIEVYSLKSKCNLCPGEVALDVLFTYSKL